MRPANQRQSEMMQLRLRDSFFVMTGVATSAVTAITAQQGVSKGASVHNPFFTAGLATFALLQIASQRYADKWSVDERLPRWNRYRAASMMTVFEAGVGLMAGVLAAENHDCTPLQCFVADKPSQFVLAVLTGLLAAHGMTAAAISPRPIPAITARPPYYV